MSNSRFYIDDDLTLGATVKLTENVAIHATRVLRFEVSDEIVLFNGDGFDYNCQLVSVKKSEVLAIVQNQQSLNNESPLNISLLQGISSGDRMDITIQKAVELGVTRIIPIKTTRSVVKLKDDRAEKRLSHWQHVVIAACEQSGRSMVPKVAAPISLADWLFNHKISEALRITLDPLATKQLKDLKDLQEIELLVGAEGGLTESEVAMSVAHGFVGVQLGGRILRTETAPLAAIAAMQTLWGDF